MEGRSSKEMKYAELEMHQLRLQPGKGRSTGRMPLLQGKVQVRGQHLLHARVWDDRPGPAHWTAQAVTNAKMNVTLLFFPYPDH
jgi:hypothetical protein